MEDILELTKDYFKKSKKEQEDIVTLLKGDIEILLMENNITFPSVENKFYRIIRKAEKREDYEVAYLFLLLLKEFQEKTHEV